MSTLMKEFLDATTLQDLVDETRQHPTGRLLDGARDLEARLDGTGAMT
jgi:hypothetical protein